MDNRAAASVAAFSNRTILDGGDTVELVRTMPNIADKKPAFDYAMHYIKGFIRNLKEVADSNISDRDAIKRAVFFGVKYVSVAREDGDPELLLKNSFTIIGLMALLTPAELVTVFPVTKTFSGERTESKDYFFTMAKLQEHGMGNAIREAAESLLWDYVNIDIEHFTIRRMGLVDQLRREEGKPGMIEEFFGIKPRYLVDDERGKQYLYDPATGRTVKVRPKRKLHAVASVARHR